LVKERFDRLWECELTAGPSTAVGADAPTFAQDDNVVVMKTKSPALAPGFSLCLCAEGAIRRARSTQMRMGMRM
jgi:hypothetical protein